MVALFAGALVAISIVMTRDSYDRALSDAFDRPRIGRRRHHQQPRHRIPGAAQDRSGGGFGTGGAFPRLGARPAGDRDRRHRQHRRRRAASFGSNSTLNDYLGPAQPLTIFAEKAGVLRIDLADGSDALATVRTLAPPFGQVAIVYPMAAVLAEWEAASFRAAVLVICTVVVLIALAIAYFWQASRAREANQLCERMQARVDTALGRGRCGLWDWDLARGRIYWSDSMYEILGMSAAGQFLSFGDINALVHPQDGDLAAMAEMLASSQADSIDHVFRMQNVKGEWIWLRARAELVHETAGRTPASRRNRRRHHRAKGARRAHRHGRPAPARRHRDGIGGFRSLGRRQPARHVQFQVPEIPSSGE